MINILILSHQNDTEAMMNLLIKAMKTVLPPNDNLLLTRLLRMPKQIDIHNITDRATLEAVITTTITLK